MGTAVFLSGGTVERFGPLVDGGKTFVRRQNGLFYDDDAFHLRMKGADVWKIAGVRERMTPRLSRYDRAGIK